MQLGHTDKDKQAAKRFFKKALAVLAFVNLVCYHSSPKIAP
jgi:hypothetical protein